MDIKVYSKPDCGACDITKQWLEGNGIEYEAIDVTEDAEALDEIKEKGYMQLPVVNVDNWERSWSGFDFQNLGELL